MATEVAEQRTTWAEAERFARATLYARDGELQLQFQAQLVQMNTRLLEENQFNANLRLQNAERHNEIIGF